MPARRNEQDSDLDLRFGQADRGRKSAAPDRSQGGPDKAGASRVKALEDALRRSEETLRVALDAARMGSWDLDLRTGEFKVSATCKSDLGLDPDAPLTFEMIEAMRHPDDSARVAEAIRTAIETGRDYEIDYRVNRADGTVGRLVGRGHAVFENGMPVRMIGVTLDVTERERDRQARQDLERRQSFLLELNDRLRSTQDPWSMMETAFTMLGRYLGAGHAGFAEVDHDDVFGAHGGTDDPVDSGTGRLRLVDLGPRLLSDLERGLTLALRDVEQDPRAAGTASRWEALGIRALLAVPLVRNGRLVGIIHLHEAHPRAWSEQDISVAVEGAEKTWAAVERAQAEAELRVSEAKFRMIGEALPAFVWVLGKDLRLTYANERWISYSGLSPEEALGFSWMAAIHPDDLKEIEVVIREILIPSEKAYAVEARYRPPGGEYRWHLIRADPIRDARGELTGWCGASVDIHDRKVAEAALRDSAERLRIALQAARMGNWTWDAASDQVTLSDPAAEIFGAAPETVVTWAAMQDWLHPVDAARAAAAVERAVVTGEQYDLEYRVRRVSDGAVVWVAAKGQATYGHDGELVGMAGVVQDVTDRKHAEERQQLLIRELHHRVKNTLATVQAIVSSTARTASNMDQFYEGFVGRIVSLAKTHDLLTEDLWQKASLEELLRHELGPYEDEGRTRVLVEGPDVEFPSEAAVPIGMAIHELTTNAAKHGAFSTSEGRVEVRWNVAERPTGPVLNLTWRETGGPPVRKPERQGFGSRLLQRLLAAQLQAHVEMAYDEAGIRCVIEMPVPTDTALLNPLS